MHCSNFTWVSWRRKSLPTRLFIQQFIQANKNEISNLHIKERDCRSFWYHAVLSGVQPLTYLVWIPKKTVTGWFSSQWATNVDSVSMSWHNYGYSLQWRHNGCNGVSHNQPHDCLLNRLYRRRSKKNIKAPRHWPLCGEFTGDRWIPRTNGQ